ncbi:MAG: phage holin family protein [bacterium]
MAYNKKVMNAFNLTLIRFFLRWVVCSLGIWIAVGLLGTDKISYGSKLSTILIAGFVIALVNVFVKPLVVILSLPAILLSLGLFMIIVNGLMVFIASKLYTPLHVTNFWVAILAGMIIGLVNYLVTAIIEER